MVLYNEDLSVSHACSYPALKKIACMQCARGGNEMHVNAWSNDRFSKVSLFVYAFWETFLNYYEH